MATGVGSSSLPTESEAVEIYAVTAGSQPVHPRRPSVAISALVSVSVAGAAAAGSLARQGSIVFDTAYAEDAKVFLSDALSAGVTETIGQGYAGYLHSLPRLLAAGAALFPVGAAAMVMAVLSALTLGGLAAVVFSASGTEVRGWPARLALVACMVAVPVGQEEVFNNLANLHWFLMFTAGWVLLWQPRSAFGTVVGAAVLVLAGLSDPLTVLLAPLLALRLVRRGRAGGWVFPAAWVVGLGLQLLAIVLGSISRGATDPLLDPARLGTWFGFRVLVRGVVGSSSPLGDGSLPALAVAGVVGAMVGWWMVRRLAASDQGVRLLVTALGSSAVAFHLVPSAITGASPERYSVVPILLLVSAVVLVADRGCPGPTAPSWSLVRAAVVVTVGLLWLANLPLSNSRDDGPRWLDGIRVAQRECRAGAAVAAVPIVPEGWTADIPCRALQAAASGEILP